MGTTVVLITGSWLESAAPPPSHLHNKARGSSCRVATMKWASAWPPSFARESARIRDLRRILGIDGARNLFAGRGKSLFSTAEESIAYPSAAVTFSSDDRGR